MDNSPFNEINNENYFYSIVVLTIILLAVNLIGSTTFDGIIISLLSTLYTLSLARFIYLYQIKGNIFLDNENIKELPKVKTVKEFIKSKNLNSYQVIAIVIFGICFILGIIFGNVFPACGSTSNLYTTCTITEFNFSLTLSIWFISFLVTVLFYGMGKIISLLSSINEKLGKKK